MPVPALAIETVASLSRQLLACHDQILDFERAINSAMTSFAGSCRSQALDRLAPQLLRLRLDLGGTPVGPVATLTEAMSVARSGGFDTGAARCEPELDPNSSALPPISPHLSFTAPPAVERAPCLRALGAELVQHKGDR